MSLLKDKTQALALIKESIINNQPCCELAAQAQQLVFGSGNVESKVVLIGEAPGKKEDETGEPFVGMAGKLLDELLATVNLSRHDVYITNIVKYRPPNNRDPSEREKAAFLPYLVKQLEVLQPQLVVTLGKHAASCFDAKLVISKEHGIVRPLTIDSLASRPILKDVLWLPLYHPAAALYNGALRQVLFNDFLHLDASIIMKNPIMDQQVNEQLIKSI